MVLFGWFRRTSWTWTLRYQGHDSQGGWWPHVETFDSEERALQQARRLGPGTRNVTLSRAPVGQSEVIFERPGEKRVDLLSRWTVRR